MEKKMKKNKFNFNKTIKEELIYAIKNCYSSDVLIDLYDLIVDFDTNSKTSSLKEFINNKMEKK